MFTYFQYGALCYFQQYFSYIVEVNFIGGGAITKPESLYSELLID